MFLNVIQWEVTTYEGRKNDAVLVNTYYGIQYYLHVF